MAHRRALSIQSFNNALENKLIDQITAKSTFFSVSYTSTFCMLLVPRNTALMRDVSTRWASLATLQISPYSLEFVNCNCGFIKSVAFFRARIHVTLIPRCHVNMTRFKEPTVT